MVRFAAPALALTAFLLGAYARANELLLLDFWSASCGPCMQMKPTVKTLINANYPIREVDVTRDAQLARNFRVDRIPCFVMLVNGQEVDRVVGATSSERLVQMFDRARIRLQSPDDQRPAPTAKSVPWPETNNSTLNSVPVDQPSSVPVAAPATQEPVAETGQPVLDSPSRLLAATVRLHVEDSKGRSFGTGTIIDARSGEALIITCGHLFRDSQGKGTLLVDLYEAGPQGLRVVGQVPGQVISYDLERDIAFLSIRPNRTVGVATIAPAQTTIERGDRAVSIGCSNGQDPTALATRVTSRDRYQGPPNIETSGAPVEGRSGGGLFNAEGQLVGVCFAADHEGNEGLYAALDSIHDELDRLGLKEIYAKSAPSQIVRGQEPATPVAPMDDRVVTGPATNPPLAPITPEPTMPHSLSAPERAAFEEIMSRAAEHEVVCIIRPKDPGGQSEVIVLDEVSPEFIQALRERRDTAPAAEIR